MVITKKHPVHIAVVSLGFILLLTGCSSDPGGADGSTDADWNPSVSHPGNDPVAEPPAAPLDASAEAPGDPREAVRAPSEEPAFPASDRNAPPVADEEVLHPSELEGVVELRRIRLGHAKMEPLVDLSGVEGIPEDPEADAVQRGRRLVGPIDAELVGAFDRPEELAQTILDAVFFDNATVLHDLRITKEEFATIFWPEFPHSRPFTNITAKDAWIFHDAECQDGVSEALHQWAGNELQLWNIRYGKGIARYRNFNLYEGVVLEAVTDHGERIEFDLAKVLCERNGQWKVYMYES